MREIIVDNVKYHCFEEGEVSNPFKIKPILITEDKVEIYEGESVWCLDTSCMQFHFIVINNTYKDYDLGVNIKLFRHKSEVLKYIEENEPKFSKKQVLEAINTIYNSSYGDVLVDKIKKKLGI